MRRKTTKHVRSMTTRVTDTHHRDPILGCPTLSREVIGRPENALGQVFSGLIESVLRGSPGWSDGESELFTAYVSSLNRALF